MNETVPSSATAALASQPLPSDAIPAAVQKLLLGPTPSKLMAAKGMAALRPAELLIALYQLTFDGDGAVKTAAEAAPDALPDKVLVGALGEALPGPVLHFFAGRMRPARIEALEKILYNGATLDETFVLLASRLLERELEIIFQNEARILRHPVILQALYFNPRARMSSLNRSIELCARNKIQVDGIPAYDEVVKSILEDSAATRPEEDVVFAGVLEVTASLPPLPEDPETGEVAAAPLLMLPGPPPSPDDMEIPDDNKKSVIIDFARLKLHQKIRLATLGNEYCRQNLIRDPNKIVALSAIRSPKLTDGEVVKYAASRAICEDVIRFIANQREFVKMHQVKVGLVNNPKCPLAFSLRYLAYLHAEEVKAVSRSKNIPSALAMAARKLMQTRGAR